MDNAYLTIVAEQIAQKRHDLQKRMNVSKKDESMMHLWDLANNIQESLLANGLITENQTHEFMIICMSK